MSAIEHDRWVLEPLGDGKVRIRHKDWDHLDVEVPVEVLEKGVALVRGSQQELIKGVMETLTTLAHQGGHSVVVVTHDNRIFKFGDRMVRIEDGRILEAGEGDLHGH